MEGIVLNIIPTMGPMAVHESTLHQPLEIYPNPVSDVLYIKNLPCERMDYTIFNLLGQEVAAGSSCGILSVAGLEKGLYFLQIKGFGIVNKAEIDVFLELSCFFDDPADIRFCLFFSS